MKSFWNGFEKKAISMNFLSKAVGGRLLKSTKGLSPEQISRLTVKQKLTRVPHSTKELASAYKPQGGHKSYIEAISKFNKQTKGKQLSKSEMDKVIKQTISSIPKPFSLP